MHITDIFQVPFVSWLIIEQPQLPQIITNKAAFWWNFICPPWSWKHTCVIHELWQNQNIIRGITTFRVFNLVARNFQGESIFPKAYFNVKFLMWIKPFTFLWWLQEKEGQCFTWQGTCGYFRLFSHQWGEFMLMHIYELDEEKNPTCGRMSLPPALLVYLPMC